MSVRPAACRRLPIEAYRAHGASAGLQWTKPRERLLHLIWTEEKPLGAYEAADRLSGQGARAHATSIYRWMQSFEEAGLVLPIVTWNRFLLSPDPAVKLWGLLLCRGCRACIPVNLAPERPWLERTLGHRGFEARRYCVECEGQCSACTFEKPKLCA